MTVIIQDKPLDLSVFHMNFMLLFNTLEVIFGSMNASIYKYDS